MKKVRMIALILTLAMMFSLTAPVFAAGDATGGYIGEEGAVAHAWNPGANQVCYDGYGNMYSPAVFPTLNAAKAYFGSDWTYTQCEVSYGGGSYNCCYCFSDDTKCFFNIREWF